MKDWMSENSKKHYGGVPNKDECMNLAGEVSLVILVLLAIVVAVGERWVTMETVVTLALAITAVILCIALILCCVALVVLMVFLVKEVIAKKLRERQGR